MSLLDKERCTKPHQTGMEQKWEGWILETLNWLGRNQVNAYDGGWNTNSVAGMELPKGKLLEIPARLNLFAKAVSEGRREAARMATDLIEEKNRHREEKERHSAVKKIAESAEDLLERCYLNTSGGYDARENLDVNKALEAYMRKRRPHLFEEKEDSDDKREA